MAITCERFSNLAHKKIGDGSDITLSECIDEKSMQDEGNPLIGHYSYPPFFPNTRTKEEKHHF